MADGPQSPAKPQGKLVTLISRRAAWVLTRPGLRKALRARHVLRRKLGKKPAVVNYFHQADDPYSHLCVQVLDRLAAAYRIGIDVHLVDAPADSAAPDRERLGLWSRRDSARIGLENALDVPGAFSRIPSPEAVTRAEQALTLTLNSADFAARAVAIGRRLWSDDKQADKIPDDDRASVAETLAAKMSGNSLRHKLGHYLGATFQFDGEWYWGLDRLHFLEQRLIDEGLALQPQQGLLFPARGLKFLPVARPAKPAHLHFFCSFRSPYTYLALARVRQLAAHYGAELCLRPVLPMVMRGLAVPREKRFYIISDVAREAQRLGIDYGLMIDPVGRPVERGYAVLAHAMSIGRGMDFADSFLRGVWSEGVDAGTDAGLYALAQRAGIDHAAVDLALKNEAWRGTADINRQELLSMDLWGVPSFRVNDGPGQWGQDRLWLIEQDLIAAAARS